MLGPGSDLCRVHPVSRWPHTGSQENMAPDLLEAGRQAWFSQLEGLSLAGWWQTIGELERILARSDFERLRELDLTLVEGLADLPEILGRSPLSQSLRIFRCGHNPYPLGALDDPRELTRAGSRTTQRAFPHGMPARAGGSARLLRTDCCRELTSLDVRDEPDRA